MKIESIRIENFRAFEDETVNLNDYTCLVGPNGSGKSTVLTALNLFFRHTGESTTDLLHLGVEDFHKKDITKPVRITVTFTDLSADAATEFGHYFRQGRLTVSAQATWDAGNQVAQVDQYGQRLGIKDFAPFFEADKAGELVGRLKDIYGDLRNKHSSLPTPGTKAAMLEALKQYENRNSALCELIPSRDQFYGATKGGGRLEHFIKWIYVPAVKDATTEQLEQRNTALGELLARTVRLKLSFGGGLDDLRSKAVQEYLKLLRDNKGALDELSNSLSQKLQHWAHPNVALRLQWQENPTKAVSIGEPAAEVITKEGVFEGQLARFGHGLQRSFLLALLQELASSTNDRQQTTLILACEEPELYQHPPQARYLSTVLQTLSTQGAQVLVSTHSPYFISGRGFEDIRLVRKTAKSGHARSAQVTFADLAAEVAKAGGSVIAAEGERFKVQQSLYPSINEMFFCEVLVLIEGAEDAAYITTTLSSIGLQQEFRRFGCHLVYPNSGKSGLVHPLAIAKKLEIPVFLVFDGDGKWGANSRAFHSDINLKLLKLCGVTDPAPFPTGVSRGENFTVWPTTIGDVVREDIGGELWQKAEEAVRKEQGLTQVGDLKKNNLFVAYMLAKTKELGGRATSLEKLCTDILGFAKAAER